jgi:hypothetical protein
VDALCVNNVPKILDELMLAPAAAAR